MKFFERKCLYCGESTGFFKTLHEDCKKKQEDAKQLIIDRMVACFQESGDFFDLEPEIRKVANDNYIDDKLLMHISAFVYKQIAEAAIDQNKWSEKVDNSLMDLEVAFNIEYDYLYAWGITEKISKAKIIYGVENGQIPYLENDILVEGIMFQKGERPIYCQWGVFLYQQVKSTQYRGTHAGLSFRIAKGMYFKTGGFQGEPVHTTEMKQVAYGNVVITDTNIFFKSPEKSLRISFSKIISLEPYNDGLGVNTDGVREASLIIQNVDGWFLYNLIALVAQKK